MNEAWHDGILSPCMPQQLVAIEVSKQALHGNEVSIVVLSYRNPLVLTKSFMLIGAKLY
jgi:hypothetical protein